MGKPFKLSVKAVIEDRQGRCLLIRRSPLCKNYAGQWEWPGGKVDPGEEYPEATYRETIEECGIEIELTGLAGAFEFEVAAVRVVCLCMEVRQIGGKLKLSEEHDEYAWVSWADISQWDLAENAQVFMQDYAKQKSEGQQM